MQLGSIISSGGSARFSGGASSAIGLASLAASGASPADRAALIGAVLQLQLVQSVISAIQTSERAVPDRQASDRFSGSQACVARACDARHEPRKGIHPTPHYEPRQVIHPAPRIEPDPLPIHPRKCPGPKLPAWPQPPWQLLPWQNPAPPRPIIKTIVIQPDTTGKGNLIDLFI